MERLYTLTEEDRNKYDMVPVITRVEYRFENKECDLSERIFRLLGKTKLASR